MQQQLLIVQKLVTKMFQIPFAKVRACKKSGKWAYLRPLKN